MTSDGKRRAARTIIQATWAAAATAAAWVGLDVPETAPDAVASVAVAPVAGALGYLANALEDRDDWLRYVGKALSGWVNKVGAS